MDGLWVERVDGIGEVDGVKTEADEKDANEKDADDDGKVEADDEADDETGSLTKDRGSQCYILPSILTFPGDGARASSPLHLPHSQPSSIGVHLYPSHRRSYRHVLHLLQFITSITSN